MLRNMRRHIKSRGQALILVALGLILTLLFAGLAIDGSNVYQQRRRMQNAADGGSLAGARSLAAGGNTNSQILQTVQYYAGQNGATSNSVTAWYVDNTGKIGQVPNDNNNPPASAVGVDAYAQTTFKVFFSGVMGLGTKTASAEAVARMGAVGSLNGGAFPVALNTATLNNVAPGTKIDIWDSSNQITDSNGNVISNSQRGWVNFNWVYSMNDPNSRTVSKSHSNADLKGWVDNGYASSLYAGAVGGMTGDFINDDPGVRASTIQEAQTRIGQTVFIPVYDTTYTGSQIAAAGGTQPNIGWSSGNNYHVVGFAAFLITNAVATGPNKYIEGQFVKQISGGAIFPGGFSSSSTMVAIGLTK